jgi:hypothetical protein
MRKLINIQDVRDNAKQIGKQINQESFNAYCNRIQKRQLTELLGQALIYDFFDFLDNGFTVHAGIYVRDSETQLTVTGEDLSLWAGYSLKINDEVFVIVKTATFDGADTVFVVEGYNLPTSISSLAYATENKYLELLNGCTYTYDGKTIKFDGLRAFLCYHWIVSYMIDGNLKQSDVGNFSITGDLFQQASPGQLNTARSEYLQNAISESNYIKQYLNTMYADYPLWEKQGSKNLVTLSWDVF